MTKEYFTSSGQKITGWYWGKGGRHPITEDGSTEVGGHKIQLKGNKSIGGIEQYDKVNKNSVDYFKGQDKYYEDRIHNLADTSSKALQDMDDARWAMGLAEKTEGQLGDNYGREEKLYNDSYYKHRKITAERDALEKEYYNTTLKNERGIKVKSSQVDTLRKNRSEVAREIDVKNAESSARTAYLYKDEGDGDFASGYNSSRDRWGKDIFDEAYNNVQDKYYRVKGDSMGAEGETYNGLYEKDKYSQDAIDKYQKSIDNAYSNYYGDSHPYNVEVRKARENLESNPQYNKTVSDWENGAISTEQALNNFGGDIEKATKAFEDNGYHSPFSWVEGEKVSNDELKSILKTLKDEKPKQSYEEFINKLSENDGFDSTKQAIMDYSNKTGKPTNEIWDSLAEKQYDDHLGEEYDRRFGNSKETSPMSEWSDTTGNGFSDMQTEAIKNGEYSKESMESDLKWFEDMSKQYGNDLSNDEDYQSLKKQYDSMYGNANNSATKKNLTKEESLQAYKNMVSSKEESRTGKKVEPALVTTMEREHILNNIKGKSEIYAKEVYNHPELNNEHLKQISAKMNDSQYSNDFYTNDEKSGKRLSSKIKNKYADMEYFGFHRMAEDDFSDDGTRFHSYRDADTGMEVTKAGRGGYTFVSPHMDYGVNYDDLKQLSLPNVDKFNGYEGKFSGADAHELKQNMRQYDRIVKSAIEDRPHIVTRATDLSGKVIGSNKSNSYRKASLVGSADDIKAKVERYKNRYKY